MDGLLASNSRGWRARVALGAFVRRCQLLCFFFGFGLEVGSRERASGDKEDGV